MRIVGMFFALLILGLPLDGSARSPSPKKGPADLYFLAVGAGNAHSEEKKINAAGRSARVVARALIDAGARYGIVLTSGKESKNYVTRQDVLNSLTRLKHRIRQDRSRAPRVLIYLMMHGAADTASKYIFMFPDNLKVQEDPIEQQYVFRLAKRTIWNNDLLTSLMDFRLDERLSHFDDFVYSSLYSDKLGLAGTLEQSQNIGRFINELDARSASYGSAPFDNAPIPFVLLMDNCTDGFDYSVAKPNKLLNLLSQQLHDATLDGGLAFYAVPPGWTASPLSLPNDLTSPDDKVRNSEGKLVNPYVGPLAIHLKNLLVSRDTTHPMSLAQFAHQFSVNKGKEVKVDVRFAAYQVEADLRSDVETVDFLPAVSDRRGKIETIPTTETSITLCCARID